MVEIGEQAVRKNPTQAYKQPFVGVFKRFPGADGSALLPAPAPLVLTGGVITDAVRAAGIEGDALGQTDAYTVTNLVTNGGFETNTTGWTVFAAATIARVTNESKFGSASLKVSATSTSQLPGTKVALAGLTIGRPHTFSAWVKAPLGQAMALFDFASASNSPFTGTGDWQRITRVITPTATTMDVYIERGEYTNPATVDFYVDGVQFETGSVVHDYLETDGATATQTFPATFAGDSSMGVWEATTNLWLNGGVETNTTGFLVTNASTLTRDTSERKFGTASLKILAAGDGYAGAQISGTFAAAPHVISCWVKGGPGTAGKSFRIANATHAAFTLTEGWQRLVATFTGTGGALSFFIQFNGSAAAGNYVFIDGVQIEAKAFATPYVHTDGATATRATGVVRAPVLFTASQGWILVRFRPGKPVAQMDYDRYWGWWSGSLSAYLTGKYITGQFGFDRATTGNGVVQTRALTPGTPASIICAWTPTAVKLSGNGTAFATAVSSAIPVPSENQVYLGSFPFEGLTEMCGELLSVAMGDGDLTNADALAMHNWLAANDDALVTDRRSLHPSCTGFYDMRTLVGK